MDTPAPTSFIPKKPLDSNGTVRSGGAYGSLAFLISLLFFIPSIIAGGAVFTYQAFLTNSIAQKSASLQAAEAAFDPATIQSLERLDSRINNAQTLLQQHVAPSAIFDFLSAQTLQSIQLQSFTYSLGSDGSAEVDLTGLGSSFSAVALQSDQFSASQVLSGIVFSGITLNPNGTVSFSVKATVNSSLINYGNYIGGGTAASSTPTSATTTPATASTTTTTTTTTNVMPPPQP